METKTFKVRDEHGKVILALHTYDSIFFAMCKDEQSKEFLQSFKNLYVTVTDFGNYDVQNYSCVCINEYFLITVDDLLSCNNEKDYFNKCADIFGDLDEVSDNEDIT